MNPWQKLMHWAFNWQYVTLIHFDGERQVRRVKQLGKTFYAQAYSCVPESMKMLLHNGEVSEKDYVIGWSPVTPWTYELFNYGKKAISL